MSTPDGHIRELLPRAWFPFFSRFGKLLDVQRQCVPKVLQGSNLVVCSPTASGKTEAVLAPLVEKLLAKRWNGLSILWVSPTRALVNDLSARFTHPLDSLRVSFARKTGDRPEFDPHHPASVLITTPESFDSLLSRHPAAFEHLKAVVLDDVHLVDSTYRGDQVRVLLERLKRICSADFNTYALSATIEAPIDLARRYMSHFESIEVPSSKGMQFALLPANESLVSELIDRFRARRIRKVLIFVNSRSEAEATVSQFQRPPFVNRAFTHHGSLSKQEREAIERFMNTSSTGICVATTTLELGIDIGDIDAVVLCGPPHDVRSLLQRVGRGNRRRQDIALAYGVYRDNWEKLLFEVLFREAQAGRLEAETYSPHISVVVQQIFSYLYQRRRVGTTFQALRTVLVPIAPEENVPSVLDHLTERDYIRSVGDNLFAPSDRLLRLARRGLIHSNIDRMPSEYTVVSIETGRALGSVQLITPQFHLGGRNWEVVRIGRDTVWVQLSPRSLPDGAQTFKGKMASWDYRLGLRVKEHLFPNFETYEFPYRHIAGAHYLFHFCGPVYGFLWQEALRDRKMGAEDAEGKCLIIYGATGIEELLLQKDHLLQALANSARLLKRALPLGAFFTLLPRDLQLEAVGRALRLDAFFTHLGSMTFREISDRELASAMKLLAMKEDPTHP